MKPLSTLTAAEVEALERLGTWLRARFGPRLRELTLFGSRARGEGHEHSDVDVLVVVDDLTFAEGREMTDLCGDLLTELSVLLAPFAVTTEHMTRLRERDRLIAREIARDGVPL